MTDLPVCEVCGLPAASFVYDTKYFNNYFNGWKEYKINGRRHAFCPEHDRPSISTYGGDILLSKDDVSLSEEKNN